MLDHMSYIEQQKSHYVLIKYGLVRMSYIDQQKSHYALLEYDDFWYVQHISTKSRYMCLFVCPTYIHKTTLCPDGI